MSDFLRRRISKAFDWPGNCPNLNPIENFRSMLKDNVTAEHPTSAKDLKIAIKRIWTQKRTAEYCKNLVHSMLCCLQIVIKNKDGLYLHENWQMLLIFKLTF